MRRSWFDRLTTNGLYNFSIFILHGASWQGGMADYWEKTMEKGEEYKKIGEIK